MTDSEEILQRASKILEEHKTGIVLEWFFNSSYQFTSTPGLKFEKHPSFKFKFPERIADGVRVSNAENAITIVRPYFEASYFDDAPQSHGEVYVYFQEQLVLQLSATEKHGTYGSRISVSTYPFSIKAMIAGPWMKLLPEYYDHLSKNKQRREDEKAEVEKRLKAEKIQLDGY